MNDDNVRIFDSVFRDHFGSLKERRDKHLIITASFYRSEIQIWIFFLY